MKTLWIILISVLVAAGLAGGGTYYYLNQKSTDDKNALQAQITDLSKKFTDTEKSLAEAQALATAATDETAAWKTYTDSVANFSFKYPSEWKDVKFTKKPNSTTSPVADKGTEYYSDYNGSSQKSYDWDNAFSFSYNTADFSAFPMVYPSGKKVNINWSQKEFSDNMLSSAWEFMGYKKLGSKGVMAILHNDYECSPDFPLLIYVPLKNETYTNLIIRINTNRIGTDDPTLKAYQAAKHAQNLDACDTTEPYQTIADKIIAGTYSDAMKAQIEIARKIADSFTNL